MSNQSECEIIIWSNDAFQMVRPLFYICILGTITHGLFWIQFLLYPSVRQASMQWLYAYLLTDLFLIFRLFFLYIYHWSSFCVPYSFRTIVCFIEAILDNYLNLIQSYILFALDLCRYLQVARNRNVYEVNRKMIIAGHLLIYFVPWLLYFILIQFQWIILYRPEGDACDFIFTEDWVQIFWLFVSYGIPVTLTFIFFYLSLRFIRDVRNIRTQQIANARLRYYRRLVIQSSVFYIVSLCLWSPYLLTFPFVYRQSLESSIVQILSYSVIVLDPIIISALDVRFLKVWRSTWFRFRDFRRRTKRTAPIATIPVFQK